MREKKWTPGPWYKVHTHSDPDTAASLAYIANTRRPQIAHELASIYGCDSDDSQEANAHLMAAAPELVEALEAIYSHPNCRKEVEAQLGEDIWDPLRKAYGESHD